MKSVHQTVFLLSPADCAAHRAQQLMNPAAKSPLATRLRGEGLPLGEMFSYMSGLYFRGKLTYARAYARPRAGCGIHVITPGRGPWRVAPATGM